MILAITGHRPSSQYMGGYNLPNQQYIKICQAIENQFKILDPTKIISGMALGTDQWAAHIATQLNIPFIAAIPFKNQEIKWNDKDKKRYNKLLTKAQEIVIVSDGPYSVEKMQIRNQWMINNSDMLLAVFNGSKGGTANCISYAEFVEKPIVRIDPANL